MQSEIVKGVASVLIPVQFVLSIYFLLRGHNLPGGGFIAGLLVAAAFTMQEVVYDKRTFLKRELNPMYMVKVGLALAILAGIWGWVVHGVFLQGVWGFEIWLPILGKIKTGSVLIFDLGVFLLVAGFMTQLVYTFKELDT